jgi:hypothetical protein
MDEVSFEAAFLRASLLVGLVHEREIASWAVGLMEHSSDHRSRLADVALARPELSSMREALRPIAEGTDAGTVTASLLMAVALEPAYDCRPASRRLTVLGHIRKDFLLPPELAVPIKAFEDRAMLARVGVAGVSEPEDEEIAGWLDTVRDAAHFQFTFNDIEEAAAFAAAVSRKVIRNRTWHSSGRHQTPAAQAWLVRRLRGPAFGVVLNERAWLTVVNECSPVPLGARIPRTATPSGAVEIVGESTAVLLGADEVQAVFDALPI